MTELTRQELNDIITNAIDSRSCRIVTSPLTDRDAALIARELVKRQLNLRDEQIPDVDFYQDLVAFYKFAEIAIAQYKGRL